MLLSSKIVNLIFIFDKKIFKNVQDLIQILCFFWAWNLTIINTKTIFCYNLKQMTILTNWHKIENNNLSTLFNIAMGVFLIWFAHQVVRYIRTYVTLDKIYQKLQNINKAEITSAFKDTFSIYYKNNDVWLSSLCADSIFNEIQVVFISFIEGISRRIFKIIVELLETIVALTKSVVFKTLIWVNTSQSIRI